jgi:hypothetical protein
MNPFVALFLLLALPFASAIILLVPIHMALYSACYIIYAQAGTLGPLEANWFDPFFIMETYLRLLDYWEINREALPLLTHTLPLFGIPLLIAPIAMMLTYHFFSFMRNLIQNAGW